jgi:hypothetical protein
MKIITLLFSLLISFAVTANINQIDIKKVTTDASRVELFRWLIENQSYYSHWTPEWNADKSREELSKKLTEVYGSFLVARAKSVDYQLLLGDVAHYLYNLDVKEYYDSAVTHYKKAKQVAPNDFRTDWFLAFHYAQSSALDKGVSLFLMAEKELPAKTPAEFWSEYVWTMSVANMPSHAIFGMDQEKKILGKKGFLEEQLGETIRKRLIAVDRDSTYQRNQIWSFSPGEKNSYTSRLLGVRATVDSSWNVIAHNYAKRFSALILNPTPIKTTSGKVVNYTIAIMMKSAEDTEKLDDYIQKFVANFAGKNKINFSQKYKNIVVYEIKESSMYQDMGGGHLYFIGVERQAPNYPGLLIEEMAKLPSESGVLRYYRPSSGRTRLPGKILYGVMLDASEEIHDKALQVFKDFFENQLTLE